MDRFRSVIRRYQGIDPFKVDVALAALFVAGIVVEALLVKTDGHSRTATAIAGSLPMLAIAWRRSRPFAAVLAFGVLAALQPAVDSFFFGSATNTPFAASLFMGYSAGRWLGRPRVWLAGAVLIAAVGIGVITSQDFQGLGDLLWIGILFLPPLLAGQAIRGRVALRRELRDKAERLEAERDLAAERAVEEERNRIASELQAVVANGVSAMVVQAEAVPRLLAAGDAAAAANTFEVIEETGRDALAEMRRLLGVLRRAGERAELAPQPGLARLDALLERLRSDGLEVELSTEGERRPLAQGIDLTAFRVLQDALATAVESGATHIEVLLRFGPRDLELDVRDDRPAGAEMPLTSLRERVNLYGGHVRAGRHSPDGHLLEARLPARAASGTPAPVGGTA